MVSPGRISGGNRSGGSSRAVRNSVAHSPATASKSPVVEALVASVRRDAGEEERDQVRDEQGLEAVEVRFAGELVDRVEVQELQPGRGVQAFRIEAPVDLGHGTAAAVIPVAEGLPDQLAGGVHLSVVDGPGVDPDAGDPLPVRCCAVRGGRQPGEDLREQRGEIPAQAAAGFHHAVGEPVDRFQHHPRGPAGTGDPAQHHPAGGSPDIDGGEHARPDVEGAVVIGGRRWRRRRPPGCAVRWCARVRCR